MAFETFVFSQCPLNQYSIEVPPYTIMLTFTELPIVVYPTIENRITTLGNICDFYLCAPSPSSELLPSQHPPWLASLNYHLQNFVGYLFEELYLTY